MTSSSSSKARRRPCGCTAPGTWMGSSPQFVRSIFSALMALSISLVMILFSHPPFEICESLCGGGYKAILIVLANHTFSYNLTKLVPALPNFGAIAREERASRLPIQPQLQRHHPGNELSAQGGAFHHIHGAQSFRH